MMNIKGFDRKGSWHNPLTVPGLFWRDCEHPWKTPIKTSLSAEIGRVYAEWKSKIVWYKHTKLLGVFVLYSTQIIGTPELVGRNTTRPRYLFPSSAIRAGFGVGINSNSTAVHCWEGSVADEVKGCNPVRWGDDSAIATCLISPVERQARRSYGKEQ